MNDKRQRHRSQLRHPSVSFSALIVIVLAATAAVVESITFTINVDSGTETCLTLPTPPNEKASIRGTFELFDEEKAISAKPLRVVLYDAQQAIAYKSAQNAGQGMFSADGMGKFRLCVENGASKTNPAARRPDGEDRQVGVSIRVKSALLQQMNDFNKQKQTAFNKQENNRNTLSIEERRHLEWEESQESEKLKRTEQIAELTDSLSSKIDVLSDHLNYLKVRHLIHEDISQQTFGRIIKWNVIQGFALVCISVGQIFAIRKVVEKRRYM
eukprot:CAMPEP_0185736852 /NCGR_PEP_ID=MMETSP1171-20130828/28937_1 /TAXON_ID=374046 /ORGANISM="Helicotheca tamensis, Strain CCMP826" /LENGTH=269 /DNA_ID=CAMNT_0028407597 /DNA_START=64 /DNA_END=873 /DNA_ORIENTATION=+